MADPNEPPALRPVPGSARGRGRIVVDLSEMIDRPTRRRAGVFRRALRRETSRLRDPRRIAAIVLLSLTFALLIAGLLARGESGGADARAYWAGVRIWLNGGDPYHPTGPFLPYVYAPWMLPALRAVGGPPLGRRVVRLARLDDPAPALDDPLGVPTPTADDGGHLRDPRVPVRGQPRHRQHQPPADADAVGRPVHRPTSRGLAVGPRDLDEMGARDPLVRSSPRARACGGSAGWRISIALSVATLPLTIIQLQVLFGFGARPLRLDYLVFLWAFVPWLYRRPDPFDFLRPATWRRWLETLRTKVRARVSPPLPG